MQFARHPVRRVEASPGSTRATESSLHDQEEGEWGLRPNAWRDTGRVRLWRGFFDDPRGLLRAL